MTSGVTVVEMPAGQATVMPQKVGPNLELATIQHSFEFAAATPPPIAIPVGHPADPD